MQAGDIELCQCTLNLLTFSISRFLALRGELLGEEIDNSAWLPVQDRTPVGNWKPPLCCCFSHSKVNNGQCHWSQGNWLLKLGLKTAKSVLPGTSWLQDWVCSQMSLGWKWGCVLPHRSAWVLGGMLRCCSPVGHPPWPGWLPGSGHSLALAGCHKAAAAAQHLLAPGSADLTQINLRCCWCAKVNSPCPSDINIHFLLNGRVWFTTQSTALGAKSADISVCLEQWLYHTTLSQMLCLYFSFCRNWFVNSQGPTFAGLFANMQSSNFSHLLLAWLASWSRVGCWM